MKKEIEIAVKGALSKFSGFGEYIAGSERFSNNEGDISSISKIDRAFQSFYENYPEQYSALTQIYVFPAGIGDQDCILIIRAKKGYTSFPERSRFYDRREYFYFPVEAGFRSAEVARYLPGMKQYPVKEVGNTDKFYGVPEFDQPADIRIFEKLMLALLRRNVCIIGISPESAESDNYKLLSAVNGLPDTYLRYLGFGVCITADAFSQQYLHAYTTLVSGSDVEGASGAGQYEKFIREMYQKKIRYPDTEIRVNPGKDAKNDAFDLAGFHYLHFEVDSILSDNAYNEGRGLESASLAYVQRFCKYAGKNPYFLDRVLLIYQYWLRRDLLDETLLTEFWKNFAAFRPTKSIYRHYPFLKAGLEGFIESASGKISDFLAFQQMSRFWDEIPGIKYENSSIMDELQIAYLERGGVLNGKNYSEAASFKKQLKEKGIDLDKELAIQVDVNDLLPKDALAMIRGDRTRMTGEFFGQLIKKAGVENLYNSLDRDVSRPLMNELNAAPVFAGLLEALTVADLRKWLKLYKKENIALKIDFRNFLNRSAAMISSERDWSSFRDVEQLLELAPSSVNPKDVREFIQTVMAREGCQRLNMYKTAADICMLFSIEVPVRTPEGNLKDLVEYYLFFIMRAAQIADRANALATLKDLLRTVIVSAEEPVSEVFRIHQNLGNKAIGEMSFLQELIDLLIQKNTPSAKDNLLDLLTCSSEPGHNYFLQESGAVYKKLLNSSLSFDPQQLKRLKEMHHELKDRRGHGSQAILKLIEKLLKNQKNKPEPEPEGHPEEHPETDPAPQESKGLINWLTAHKQPITRFILWSLVLISFAAAGYFYLASRANAKLVRLQADTLRSLHLSEKKQLKTIYELEESVRMLHQLVPELAPKPNINIALKGLRANNMPLSAVVDKIYDANPENVKKVYAGQKKIYASLLMQLNSRCFDQSGTCHCDSLPQIPGYKPDK